MKKLWLAVLICLIYDLPTMAQIPGEISYQGVLLSTSGSLVADGTYALTFRLYSQETGGTPLWTETQNTPVSGGVFTVMLGAVSPLALPFDRPYYLSTAINGGTELQPRLPLSSVPYSFRAQTVDNLSVTSGSITAGTVVRSVNNLTDNVEIIAGSNIVLSTNDNTLTISATGGTVSGAWREHAGHVYTTASVGIGIASPNGRLHVGGGSFVVEGTTGEAPVHGGGTRLMWVPSLAAFRAGRAIWDEWNPGAIGHYSFAAGYGPSAPATSATAFGWLASAEAPYSTAMGNESGAYGEASFAAGNRSVALGPYAAALGTQSNARGIASLAAGESSTAQGDYSVAFGYQSRTTTTGSFAAGYESLAAGIGSAAIGQQTYARWEGAFAGGWQTQALATGATAFGYISSARGEFSTAIGNFNNAWGRGSFAAGDDNEVYGHNAVAFGYNNVAAGDGSLCAGEWNHVAGDMSFAYGAHGVLGSDYSAIGGGERNRIEEGGSADVIGGGYGNSITSASYSVIAGGDVNSIRSGNSSAISGGFYNRMTGDYSSIAGGHTNTINSSYGSIAGGYLNTVTTASFAAIGGGGSNTVVGSYGCIPGGYSNRADSYAFAAGTRSYALGSASIAMGDSAQATEISAVALGNTVRAMGICALATGYSSTADGNYSLAMGYTNTAAGDYSVAIGYNTRAGTEGAFAFGDRARANHSGAMVLAANYSLNGSDTIASGGSDQLVIRADGGIYISTTAGVAVYNTGRLINTSAGAYLTRGGTWTNASDVNLKENLVRIDGRELLEKVSRLPLYRWNYRSESAEIQHIGPIAQDFHRIFGLGGDDRAISTIDPAGVSLAAVQQLHRENTELRERVQKLEELVRQLLDKEKP